MFLGASVGCAVAGDIGTLVVFRIVEGLGGAACMVIARAVVRDLHTGQDEVRLLSFLMLMFSVSPVLAPLGGSLLVAGTSWRAVFWTVAALSLIGLILVSRLIPETRPRPARTGHVRDLLTAGRNLLTDRAFVQMAMIGASAVSGFFVFLANSPFVFTGQYSLSPRLYSVVFSVNALAFVAGMQLSGRVTSTYGLRNTVSVSLTAYAGVMVLLTLLTALGADHIGPVTALMFLGFVFLGVVMPLSSVLALADHGSLSGAAASLMGALQLGAGAAMTATSSRFADGTVVPMVAAVASCALLALALSLWRPRL
jgi:DHA1 family bicyclomycin/chloramphenicol resistance-like MFS transporter